LETIRQTVFNNRHAKRWLRLVLGLFLAVNTYQIHNSLSGVVGASHLFQAAANSGCGGSFAVPLRANKNDKLNKLNIKELIQNKMESPYHNVDVNGNKEPMRSWHPLFILYEA
jgi:hypothetical protein